MPKALIVVLVIIVVVLAGGGYFLLKLRQYKEKVKAIRIEGTDLGNVGDGTYEGFHDVDFVRARVRVTVKDHRIMDVELVEHEHGRGAKAEVLPERVVEAQSVKVDIITGATSSSKTILKAIEKALREGEKEGMQDI